MIIFQWGVLNIISRDGDDILWTSDEYAVSLDIKSDNIIIYYHGNQINYISKYNFSKDLTNIDKELYDSLITKLYKSVKKSDETIKDMKKLENKYALYEQYEEAAVIKKFLDKIG
jgi:ABC-type uncharacterized transport system auxiliary subunit